MSVSVTSYISKVMLGLLDVNLKLFSFENLKMVNLTSLLWAIHSETFCAVISDLFAAFIS